MFTFYLYLNLNYYIIYHSIFTVYIKLWLCSRIMFENNCLFRVIVCFLAPWFTFYTYKHTQGLHTTKKTVSLICCIVVLMMV